MRTWTRYSTLWFIATLLLASVPLVSGQGTVYVNNVPPAITASSIVDGETGASVNGQFINPALGGPLNNCTVTVTIRDDNTLYDIKNVTVYVYDDKDVTGHTEFANGTYNEVGSYGFAWVNASGVASWKELRGGWSDPSVLTPHQLDTSHSFIPDLSQSSGDWVFNFNMTKASRRTAAPNGWKVQIYVYDGSDAKAADNTLHFGVNFYHEQAVVTAVTWTGVTLGGANQTADGNHLDLYTYTVTANAPFMIQIQSKNEKLTGTHGQTPFNIGNVTINNANSLDNCKIAHLSTGWQDFDSNDLGHSKTNGSYWFITIPNVTRDDTYTFNFASQVMINE